MNEWISDQSGATVHPDPEELAALLDGQLSEERAARVRQHIAECEDCYEVFVTTAEVLEEIEEPETAPREPVDGNVLPFRPAPEPAPERHPRRLRPLAFAAVAACAVLAGSLFYHHFARHPTAFEQIAQPFQDGDAQQIERPGEDEWRGSSREEQELAFGLGAESFHLALQARAGDADGADKTLAILRRYWSRLPYMEGEPSPFEGDAKAVVKEIEGVRRRNARESYFDAGSFELGAWTAAGRLAAESGREAYFAGDYHRKTLHQLLGEPDLPKARLEEIRSLSAQRPISGKLKQAFQDIYARKGLDPR